ncbi:peptide ABC transporter substrate-binding protein [Motilibacter aurantiacus]|uniref:peptide ABC transporter substrate-binding protein n=1 Tax=Motilibacter aurantiacus TaxID=2714955 RepID=UPI00140B1C0B|nr:ABC transporter substrate-binding protein [Motilibacter aurantiacus]NHC46807.1 ABC transporter substrate-binding protein [Motilibacter aurantiacus]
MRLRWRGRPTTGTRTAACALALATVLAGCSGGSGDEDDAAVPDGGGRAAIALIEPASLTPPNVAESAGQEIVDALFTGLVDYDESGAPRRTGLASSITTQDRKQWTITLAEGWTFHDGTPITSSSFVDAWNYGASTGQANSSYYSLIEGYDEVAPADDAPAPTATGRAMSGLKVVDERTFTVTLSQPDNSFETQLGYAAFFPLPPEALEDPKAYDDAPIGNGPFRMQGTWQHEQLIAVERWDDYKGEKPKLQGIDFKLFGSMDTAYNELLAGEVDVMTSLPAAQLATAPEEFGDRYRTFPSSYFAYLGLPSADPELRDVRVRRALSMAIDRQQLSDVVFHGTRVPADAYVGPTVPGYRSGSCGQTCTFDPVQARTLLAAGGGLDSITVTYNADGPHKEWVEALCNQVSSNLDVQCVATPVPDFSVLVERLMRAAEEEQPFGPFRMAYSQDWPTLENYLTSLYSSAGSNNLYGYADEEVDSLIAKGRSRPDQQAAIPDWQAAEDRVAEDVPVIPLFFGTTATLRSERVQDLQVDTFERIDKIALSVTE